ncbi:hypothetical protein J6590_081328 [Homalodisca vitripennis]|nr:hypothetical protein J6590_081328 [Homalodisca vitripennis]
MIFWSVSLLPCLHGLRVLAMVWIIAGHRFMHEILVPDVNGVYIIEHLDRLAWIPYQSIGKTVEIFFLLSGTLAAYNFFRDRLKGKRFHYLSFCCHRYRRITHGQLSSDSCGIPIWKRMFSMYQENCLENWWINLLYISNYVVPYSTVDSTSVVDIYSLRYLADSCGGRSYLEEDVQHVPRELPGELVD